MGSTEDRRGKPLVSGDAVAASVADAKKRANRKRRIEAMEAILYAVVLTLLGIVVLFVLMSRSR